MDEIELLRRFRADLPGPSAGQVETARAELMKAIAHESERQSVPASRRPALRLRPAWVVAVGAAAALAIAAVLLVALASGPGGTPSAAAQALQQAASVAAAQPGQPPPQGGQYVYTKTRSAYLNLYGTWSVQVPGTREAWIAPDGSGRLRETRGEPRFLSDQQRTQWRAAGSPALGEPGVFDHPFGPRGLHYLDLSHLPTDPDALRQVIEERKVESGPPGDAETFTIIGDLLRETYASPELRAALYQVASELPGVELLGLVRDEAGREGVGVAYTDQGVRNELIFDRKTSALLGEREVLVDPGATQDLDFPAPPGTVISYASHLASGVVDSTSARAPGLTG
jgi:hypothetical protein